MMKNIGNIGLKWIIGILISGGSTWAQSWRIATTW